MSLGKNFDIIVHSDNGVDVVQVRGYLDAHTAPNLEQAIEDLVRAGKNKIIVNFQDLDYISSAGLGVFMVFIEELRQSGGDLKLTDMKPKVYSVFNLLGFPMLFDILPLQEDAVAKFIQKQIL